MDEIIIVIIEMPKGETIRRHKNKYGDGMIELGLIKDVIPVNDGINPVNYGYITGTHNPSDDDELDAIVITGSVYQVGQEVRVLPIALLRRADNDDKIVVVPKGEEKIKTWEDVPEKERNLIVKFYSYHHPIAAIENADEARGYIEAMKV